ncbi:PREDICTED: G1/S-specific cyclin-D3, partial [Phaethon lepturus]|uniref:G1/S-specific cyclin-D3 n=1 Tax=Phaethon lepturus TaxID=97097 RepID=UPI000530AABE
SKNRRRIPGKRFRCVTISSERARPRGVQLGSSCKVRNATSYPSARAETLRRSRAGVCPLADCLKACQEQIEAALAESLKQASQTQQEYSAAKTAAYPASQPTSTPTDVTDINL